MSNVAQITRMGPSFAETKERDSRYEHSHHKHPLTARRDAVLACVKSEYQMRFREKAALARRIHSYRAARTGNTADNGAA